MPPPTNRNPSEKWRDEYAFNLANQLPRVDADGKLTGKIPDFFGDFIIYPKNPTFTTNFTNICKERFFHRPLILWAPDIFWNNYIKKLKCPNPTCTKPDGKVQQKEWNSKGVRTVKHLDQDYDLLSMRYECKHCKGTFMGSELRSLVTLPWFIQLQFSFVLTKKKGYTAIMGDIASKSETSGMSVAAVTDMFNELASERFDRYQYTYLATVKAIRDLADKKERSAAANGFFAKTNGAAAQHPAEDFGPKMKQESDYTGGASYSLTPLSLGYTSTMTMKVFADRKEMMRLEMQSATGTIMKGDHTFAPAKMMRVAGKNPFAAVYTVMNEAGLLVSQHFTESKKPSETIPVLENVRDRHLKLGDGGPVKVWYTDMCCQEANTLRSVFGSDIVIKLDPFHLMQRFKRAISGKHHHCGEFLKALSKAIFMIPEESYTLLQGMIDAAAREGKTTLGGHAITAQTLAKDVPYSVARKLVPVRIPQPNDLMASVGAVIRAFSETAHPVDGSIITPVVLRVWNRQQAHINADCVSDPENFGLVSDPVEVNGMYRLVKKKYKSYRGTSQIESYHARKNKALSCTHCAPDLILALLALYNHKFNCRIKVSLGELPDLGHYDLALAEQCNMLALALGLQAPYPLLKLNKIDTGEHFGVLNSPGVQQIVQQLFDENVEFAEDNQSSDDDDDPSDFFNEDCTSDDDDGPSGYAPSAPIAAPPAPIIATQPRIMVPPETILFSSNKRPNATQCLAQLQGTGYAVKDFATGDEHILFMRLWAKHQADFKALHCEFNRMAYKHSQTARQPTLFLKTWNQVIAYADRVKTHRIAQANRVHVAPAVPVVQLNPHIVASPGRRPIQPRQAPIDLPPPRAPGRKYCTKCHQSMLGHKRGFCPNSQFE